MIEITDLRVGNIAYDDEMTIGTIARLESQAYNDYNGSDTQLVTMLIDGGYYLTDRVFGIPLSPAILEKCGFELATGYHLKIGDLRFSYYDDSNEWEVCFLPESGVWIYMPLKINSLHQLQNLVHSLTGTELRITL